MIDEIAEYIGQLDYVGSVEVEGKNILVCVSIKGDEYKLKINLGGDFPSKLPDVRVEDASKYGYLPHVCWKSKLCYSDEEGVNIDTSQPKFIVEHVLLDSIESLSVSDDEKENEFFNEFEGYWNKQETSHPAYSFIKLSKRARVIYTAVRKKGSVAIAFYDDDSKKAIGKEYTFHNKCISNKTIKKALFLPLDTWINPPLHGEEITIDFLNNILIALSKDNREFWDEYVDSGDHPKDALHLLISQPRPKGGVSLYGLHIQFAKSWLSNPSKPYRHKIYPLFIKRHTDEHLLPRSGSEVSVGNKKIVIVGCGSVGGRIAELLVTSGIKELYLIDGDKVDSENIYRQVHETQYIGISKVDSLKVQLEKRYPYLTIHTSNAFINDLSSNIVGYDAIVDATGSPTINRIFTRNHRQIQSTEKPYLLTVWLEVLGLGGHAVLSKGRDKGCLCCLYHRDNTEIPSSLFSFVEEGQVLSKNLTGCGGAFTSFSNLDVVKTAEMAVRLLVYALDESESSHKNYAFWKGKNALAKKEHIRTTGWYMSNNSEDIDLVFSEGCPVCQS